MVNKTAKIIGVPWDMGASLGRPGARYAPEYVRKNLNWILRRIKDEKIYDVEKKEIVDLDGLVIKDQGDLNLKYHDTQASLEIMKNNGYKEFKNGYFVTVIGGDHSISYPFIEALHDTSNKNMGIIHFDAHLDLLDENEMQGKYSQSSEIYRALELEYVNPQNVVQIGVRGFNYPEAYDFVKRNNIKQFTPQDVFSMGAKDIAEKTLEIVKKDTDKIYLTFDIDVLDPAFAPGTGADEPNGLNPLQIYDMLEIFAPEIACLDIVEVNPTFDHHGMTSAVGAKVLFNVIINHFK